MARRMAPEPQDRPAAQSNLEGAIESLDPDFVQCRDFGHGWRPHTAKWIPKLNHFESVLRCHRCATERVRFIGAHGQLLGNQYHYADGYQLQGFGRMTGADRDLFRFASIQGVLKSA